MEIIAKAEEIDEGNQRILEIFGVQIFHLDNLLNKIICWDLIQFGGVFLLEKHLWEIILPFTFESVWIPLS